MFRLFCSLCLLCILSGCMGDVVPPGKKVIILTPGGESRIIDKGVYKAWGRDRMYFVDQKLRSYTENLKILCADDINMDVDVKTVLSFDVSKESITFIKEKVPAVALPDGSGDELSLDKFYEMAAKDIVRSSARNIISPHETDDIRPKRESLESALAKLVRERVSSLKYPLKISAVLISNIDYPDIIKEKRQKIKEAELMDQEKAALAEADLAQAQRQVAIETENAKVRMVRARAQADENQILTESLTPQFLMWRQLEVMESVAVDLAKGRSNTVFMMPYRTMSPDMLNTALIKTSIDGLRKEGTETIAAP